MLVQDYALNARWSKNLSPPKIEKRQTGTSSTLVRFLTIILSERPGALHMKIGIMTNADKPGRLSIVDGDLACDLEVLTGQACRSMTELIAKWKDFRPRIEEEIANGSFARTATAFQSHDFEAPLRHPGKMICIGRNYAEHAAEMGSAAGEWPVVFSKFASSIIGPGQEIRLPAISEQVDFEAELVVVIGKPGENLSRESAMDHIFGYCCGNDVSARDWQKGRPGGQWLLGKTFDTFAPLGPWIVPAESIKDPTSLRIQLRLNGETMQDANTSELIFPIDYLIAHLSKFFRLEPGDLIFTGTPAGVGAGRDPKVFLKPGDQLEVEIEKIGILRNSVSR